MDSCLVFWAIWSDKELTNLIKSKLISTLASFETNHPAIRPQLRHKQQ